MAGWHRPGGGAADGTLRRVEVDGRAVCLGRVERRLGRLRRHLHARGVLALGRRARRRRRRLPLPRLRVRRPHGRRALAAGARPAADLRGARRGRRLEVRLAPTAAAAAATSADEHVPAARSPERRRAVDRRRSRSTRSTSPISTAGSRACRTTGSRCSPRRAAALAGRARRPRLLVVHPLRRHRRRLEGLRDVLVRDRRHLVAGPDAGGGRGCASR